MNTGARIRAGLLLALGGFCGAPVRAQAAAPQAARLEWCGPVSEAQRSVAGLLRSARSGDVLPEKLPAALCALGPAALPALCDILAQERIPRVHAEDAAQLLSEPQRRILLSALAQFPPAVLRAELDQRLATKPAPEELQLRILALRVLGLIGTHADLPALAGLAPRKQGEVPDAGGEPLRAAYAAILRREPAQVARLVQLLPQIDLSAAKQLLFAVGDLGDRRGMALLDTCARFYPPLAQQALALVPRLGPSDDPELDHGLAAWLAANLDLDRPEWNRASLCAIGLLDDGTQVPVLLESLRSQQRAMHQAALAALQHISAQSLGDSVEPWREWYARESAWMQHGRQIAEHSLHSKDPAVIVEALDAYAGHRLFRDDLATDILPLLEHALPNVRVMACESLARIGSKRALQALVSHISDERPAVADAAWRAACALSGQVLPRSASDARELLAGI